MEKRDPVFEQGFQSGEGIGKKSVNGKSPFLPKFFVPVMDASGENATAACCPTDNGDTGASCCASAGPANRRYESPLDMREHWNRVYEQSPPERLGWYESDPVRTLELLDRCGLRVEDHLLDAGSGASLLIDRLVERGFRHITAVDISENALDLILDRLGPNGSGSVRTLRRNLAVPGILVDVNPVDLWHDRAVLHFLLEEEDRAAYLGNLRSVLRPGGHVILSVFSLDGAERCSGLPVRRYSAEGLAEYLGPDFVLMESFDYLYHMPSGEPRPYVYALFQRRS